MTPAAIMILLSILDNVFSLGGKLITIALEAAPELKTEPLPVLDEMDKARVEALLRVSITGEVKTGEVKTSETK